MLKRQSDSPFNLALAAKPTSMNERQRRPQSGFSTEAGVAGVSIALAKNGSVPEPIIEVASATSALARNESKLLAAN